MSFETEGFFSPEMDGFRDSVKAEEPSKARPARRGDRRPTARKAHEHGPFA